MTAYSTGAVSRSTSVEEIQGLYGAFSFPERLLQKIWQRGEFDGAAARTLDGATLRVRHPGRWNHLGGPDFSEARLVIDGREVGGDVELHLHARDWNAHGHANDAAYDNVVLHVVLFPCAENTTAGAGGKRIPVLCLLPLLHHGLEEYAAEDAMERLAGRPLHHAQETLGRMGSEELNTCLRGHARARWADKVRYARDRIERLGWEDACHHAALEVLGYRFNRAPMLTIACAMKLDEWRRGGVDPEGLFGELRERWSLQGVRPLNHPKLRLAQYARWCAARPDWPEALRTSPRWTALAVAQGEMTVAEWRRVVGATAQRKRLIDEVCAGAVGGSRLDNLVCDGFLPLVAAATGLDLEPVWHGWFSGDAPESMMGILRALGVVGGRTNPVSQGPVQGLLGWLLTKEAHLGRIGDSPTGAGLDKILPHQLP